MIQLMKLEWTKHKLNQYVKYALICALTTYAATILMAVLSVQEGEMMFENYTAFSVFLNMAFRIVFQIFSAVLLVRVMLEEYTSRTITILFTSPFPRKKLIGAKLLLTSLFIFLSSFLSALFFTFVTFFMQNVLTLYDGKASFINIFADIPGILLTSLMTAGICFIPLYFGMRKKSASTMITSGVIVSLLLNVSISSDPASQSLSQFLIIPLLLCLTGIGIGYMSWKNINKTDI